MDFLNQLTVDLSFMMHIIQQWEIQIKLCLHTILYLRQIKYQILHNLRHSIAVVSEGPDKSAQKQKNSALASLTSIIIWEFCQSKGRPYH